MLEKIPSFLRIQQDQNTQNTITNGNWEVRSKRILAVVGTNIVLQYGTTAEYGRLQYLADAHNFNKMLGITDEEYNELYVVHDPELSQGNISGDDLVLGQQLTDTPASS